MANTNNIDWEYLFYYDETSPSCLRWKVDRWHGKNYAKKLRAVGDMVGSITPCKSYRVRVDNRQYFVSRIIIEMHLKCKLKSSEFVDHFDGDRFNNKVSNLRVVDHSINNRNVRMGHDNTSGVVGVSKQFGRKGEVYWVATIYRIEGGRTRKCFSENKYGEKAFNLACEFRQEQIAILNSQGAGYSDRHGK